MVEGEAMKDGIVVLTADALREIVSEAVTSALAKAGTRDESDVMDMDQAAALVRVHVKTLRKLIHEEGLPQLRPIGKLRRFSRREILAWMARRKSA
jgi:excisionase family DNA binding protein